MELGFLQVFPVKKQLGLFCQNPGATMFQWFSLPIPSMWLTYLYLHECLIFLMVFNVGKYTNSSICHGPNLNISSPSVEIPVTKRRWRRFVRCSTAASDLWRWSLGCLVQALLSSPQKSILFPHPTNPRRWQLKDFLFSPRKLGKMFTHFEEHIFQMGWFNHQPETLFRFHPETEPAPDPNSTHWLGYVDELLRPGRQASMLVLGRLTPSIESLIQTNTHHFGHPFIEKPL